MNGEIELKLNKYGDLTWAQWNDLQEAVKGTLTSMNGARHLAMINLIGEDLRATKYGWKVYSQMKMILSGKVICMREATFYLTATSAARTLRKASEKWAWVRSVHVKLMYGLLRDPLMACGWIVKVYGYQALGDLIEHYWITGHIHKGGHFSITLEGIAILNELEAVGVVCDFVIDQE